MATRDEERWEYDYLEVPPRQMTKLIDELNDMGGDGWEAFAAFSVGGAAWPNVMVMLKRRVG
jgi:hypothetical protein